MIRASQEVIRKELATRVRLPAAAVFFFYNNSDNFNKSLLAT